MEPICSVHQWMLARIMFKTAGITKDVSRKKKQATVTASIFSYIHMNTNKYI